MDVWREYMWIWMLIGTLLASLVIVLIFILINNCILVKDQSKGCFEPCHPPELNVQNFVYKSKDLEEEKPPLPPRTQFMTSNSYESIPELPEYVKVDEEEPQFPPPPRETTESCHSVDMSTEDYDDIGEENNSQGGEDYDDVG
ncbi:unnamed protein product [Lota lota]